MPAALWEIEFRVRQIAAEITDRPLESIQADSRLIQDLELDSLHLVEFVMGLEDAFGISIPDEQSRNFFTAEVETIRTVALSVQRWPKQESRRSIRPATPTIPFEEAPFTQLGPSARPSGQSERYVWLGPNREGFPEYLRRRDGMRCVLIPSGRIQLGGPDSATDRPEISITEFLLDAEPVSNATYARFLNSVGDLPEEVFAEWCGCGPDDNRAGHFPLRKRRKRWEPITGTEKQPMILVSWFGASAYSLWANECDWKGYRTVSCLPSEAQWEYAARGQSDFVPAHPVVGRHFPGSAYEVESLPAASVSAREGVSPFGALHMGGNVWQWVEDWYADDYDERLWGRQDPVQHVPTGIRSERGGSWVGPAELAQPWYRRGRPPLARGRCLGFRCAGSLEDGVRTTP